MSTEKRPWIKIDISDAIWAIGIGAMIILFVGKPDLWDVIMYRLSDGQVPIPHAETPPIEAPR